MKALSSILSLLGFLSAKKFSTIDGGPTFDITFDLATEKYKFVVDVPGDYTGLWLVWSVTGDTVTTDIT